jgi:hypothetical protein
MDGIAPTLGKGCLAGLGLAVLFVAISGLAYLVLSQFDVPPNIVLLISIASGPTTGTMGTLVVLWLWARSKAHSGQ